MVIRGHKRSSEAISGHQRPSEVIRGSSEVIRGPQWSSVVIRGPQWSSVGPQRSSEVISGHQWSSAVISGPQRSSVVISGHQRGPSQCLSGDGHQWSSEVISGHQRSSVVIRGHQWSSEVISGHQRSSVGPLPVGASHRAWPDREREARVAPLEPRVECGKFERHVAERLLGQALACEWVDKPAIISGHQWTSMVISGHQRSSAAISGHRWSSVVLRVHLPVRGSSSQRCRNAAEYASMKEEGVAGSERSAVTQTSPSSVVIRGHQRSSEVISGPPTCDANEPVISGHQRSSEVIRGHQRSSEVIRGHQRSSEVISGPPTCDANEPVVPLVCIDRVQHDARVHRRPHDLRCARHSATVRGASSRGTAQYGARYEPYAAARLWLIGHGEAIEENTARAHLRTYEKLCVLISGHQRSSVAINRSKNHRALFWALAY